MTPSRGQREPLSEEGPRKAHGDRGAGTWPQGSIPGMCVISALGAVTQRKGAMEDATSRTSLHRSITPLRATGSGERTGMVVTGQHFLTWEGAPERRAGGGLCSSRPSSGGLLFGRTAAAGGFGERVLELAATAAFGFEVCRRPRLVAVIARGAKSQAEASPACPGVADDSWNGPEKTPPCWSSGAPWPLPSFSPLGWLPVDTHFLCCNFILLGDVNQHGSFFTDLGLCV